MYIAELRKDEKGAKIVFAQNVKGILLEDGTTVSIPERKTCLLSDVEGSLNFRLKNGYINNIQFEEKKALYNEKGTKYFLNIKG